LSSQFALHSVSGLLCNYLCCRDGSLGIATKVFQTADFSGQQYFCYLVPYRHHLRSAAVDFNVFY